MRSRQPSASTAIEILRQLEQAAGKEQLAYWVAPNTVLTLAGARGYCDGIFRSNNRATLQRWETELHTSLRILSSVCRIDTSVVDIAKTLARHQPYKLSSAKSLNISLARK